MFLGKLFIYQYKPKYYFERVSHLSFYQQDEEKILKDLTSSIDGLQNSEVKKRQEKDGFNELKTKTTDSPLKLFLGTLRMQW